MTHAEHGAGGFVTESCLLMSESLSHMKDEPPLAGWPGLLCNAQYMMEKYQRQGETQRLPKESQRGKQTRQRRKKKKRAHSP